VSKEFDSDFLTWCKSGSYWQRCGVNDMLQNCTVSTNPILFAAI